MWALVSLLSALSWATSDLFSKRALRVYSDVQVIWARTLLAVPFTLPLLLVSGVPRFTLRFVVVQLVDFPLEVLALLLYMRALRLSPLGLTLPYLSLTPVLLVLTGYLILGEVPGARQLLGVLLVGAGGYLLSGEGWAPLKALLRERGSQLMLLVALIYSVTAALSKILAQESSPLFYSAYYPLVLSALFAPFALRRGLFRFNRDLWLAGGFNAGMITAHLVAITMTQASYMLALKRLSGVFGVLYGRLFFRERGFGRRLLAAGLMSLGALLVALPG